VVVLQGVRDIREATVVVRAERELHEVRVIVPRLHLYPRHALVDVWSGRADEPHHRTALRVQHGLLDVRVGVAQKDDGLLLLAHATPRSEFGPQRSAVEPWAIRLPRPAHTRPPAAARRAAWPGRSPRRSAGRRSGRAP